MENIIKSLLETDLYKFSMGQAIYHNFPDYTTTWSFKCRNKDVKFTAEMVEEIKKQILAYCDLRFKEDELTYLSKVTWIKKSYVDFLRLWHPRYEDFTIGTDAECGLTIETNGTWLNTSLYEIPTLAIVNEVYFRMAYDYKELIASFEESRPAYTLHFSAGAAAAEKTGTETRGDCALPEGDIPQGKPLQTETRKDDNAGGFGT
ncbi:MAG: hypothetical protein J5504_02960, partial [Butyrivibrio sp.]|nr:hypothetical protein [Butyrivibrio sp.]